MNASNGSGAAEKHWVARIPRRVVMHRMETADSLESRVFWAIVLWSWCGPQRSQGVVIKNEHGFIQQDSSKNPVPAKAQDLLRLLGLADGMKGHLSRALQRLKVKGSIYFKNNILYLTEDPTPPDKTQEVASTGNWHVAGLVVSTGNLPSDPDARAEAVQWLDTLSTEWKSTLKTTKTGFRKLLRQGLSERGILISLEEKRRRREERAPCSEVISVNGSSSSSSVPTAAEPTTTTSPIETLQEPPEEHTESADPPDPTQEAQFHEGVTRAFAGKGSPTPEQLGKAYAAVPRAAPVVTFVEYLKRRMPQLKHPGGLQSVALEFAREWRTCGGTVEAWNAERRARGPLKGLALMLEEEKAKGGGGGAS